MKGLCIGCLVISFILLQPSILFFSNTHANTGSPQTLMPVHTQSQETGDSRSFWARDFDAQIYYEMDATLLAIGQHCLIYMQDSVVSYLGETEATTRCESYSDEFDTLIFPVVTDLTGDPDGLIGDVDGDPRIIILISDNTMSYYSQYNEIVSTYSNLCEMVYIYWNNYLILDTIAHEFCHLIWFNYEFDEVHFILEGMAEYATYCAGYLAPHDNVSFRAVEFLQNPDDSLIYFDIGQKDYGGSYLFSFYLAERFGVQFLRDLVQQEEDGALGIEAALLEAGHNISFNELYLDWMTALTIDELGFADNQYGIPNMDVQIQEYTTIDAVPIEIEDLSIRYYGSEILSITSPPDNFTVEISEPGLGLAGVSIAYHDIEGWHVQQNTLGGQVIENVTGNSIDTVYVISSLMFEEASGGNIDFGEGFSDEVNLTITEYYPSNITPTPSTSPMMDVILTASLGVSLFAVSIVIVLILLRNKKEQQF